MVITSQEIWEGLPAETEGVEILTSSAAELALWREAMTPVLNQFEPEIDKVVIDDAVAADAST
jgi:TRAP-type C4-dicarboxylate transport system substrate-binding protein